MFGEEEDFDFSVLSFPELTASNTVARVGKNSIVEGKVQRFDPMHGWSITLHRMTKDENGEMVAPWLMNVAANRVCLLALDEANPDDGKYKEGDNVRVFVKSIGDQILVSAKVSKLDVADIDVSYKLGRVPEDFYHGSFDTSIAKGATEEWMKTMENFFGIDEYDTKPVDAKMDFLRGRLKSVEEEQQLETLLSQSRSFLEKGLFDKARELLLECLKTTPHSSELLQQVNELNLVLSKENKIGIGDLLTRKESFCSLVVDDVPAARSDTPIQEKEESKESENEEEEEEEMKEGSEEWDKKRTRKRSRSLSPPKKKLDFSSPSPVQQQKIGDEDNDIPICKFYLMNSDCSLGKECPKLHVKYDDLMRIAKK